MYPILLKLGPITIHTYGFFVASAFLTGILIASKEAARVGEDPEKIVDLSFYILIFSVIGARIFYVMTMPKYFFDKPLEIFKIWEGGLVFYGGFVGAVIFSIYYMKKHGMYFPKIADLLTPSLAIGHALGRIGCFFAGCCYGKTCDLPWAVTFRHHESLAPLGIGLHPTQLYEAINNLILFCILWIFRKRKRFDGQLFWLYVLMYGITRSIIEAFREDFRGGFIFRFLSPSQFIGICLSVFAAMVLIRGKKKETKSGKRETSRIFGRK